MLRQGPAKTAKPFQVELDYDTWLQRYFPHVCTSPLGKRHHRLWQWFDSLEPGGSPPTPRVEIWPRGGAKSSTVELAIAYIGTKKDLPRRFVLYVCATQEQADLHVQAISNLLEELGVERQLTKHGHSRGWRRNQLRTADGFHVAGLGLDVAARGIKFDEFRPDLIVFDDVDSEEDTPKTVGKKIARITKKIIPAGATNKAILFIQNIIHEDSVVNQLKEGRAKFLHNREIPEPEVAVVGLQVTTEIQPNGESVYRITGGTATWEGQSLADCEQQINDQGYEEFLRESQHEIHATEGFVFNEKAFRIIKAGEWPDDLKTVRAWDFAATHGAGDYTVGVLGGYSPSTKGSYILDVRRGQWSPDEVENQLEECAEQDWETYGCRTVLVPDDPGSAGDFVVVQIRKLLPAYQVIGVNPDKKKAVRARGWAGCVNKGNAYLVEAGWNFEYIREHRKFREDEEHEHDDQIDPSADLFNKTAPTLTVPGWDVY